VTKEERDALDALTDRMGQVEGALSHLSNQFDLLGRQLRLPQPQRSFDRRGGPGRFSDRFKRGSTIWGSILLGAGLLLVFASLARDEDLDVNLLKGGIVVTVLGAALISPEHLLDLVRAWRSRS
jgi:hypothetical protein